MDYTVFPEFFKKAVTDVLATYTDKIIFKADHISILTESSSDYEKAKEEYSQYISDQKEIAHCGRRITIATLKSKIEEQGLILEKLEISEPKPTRLSSERKIDHIAFVPESFPEFIKFSKDEKVDLYDAMEIGNVILCKWKAPNSLVEFRSSQEFVTNQCAQNDNNVSDLLKCKAESEINKDKALRALADYQNLKKRMEADRETFQFVANTTLISKLLDINDDFLRANEFVTKEEDPTKIKSAYGSVQNKLGGVINDFGLEEVSVNIGDAYDMHKMEAIGTLATEDEKENDTVKHIAAKGYKYSNKDQLVRASKVIVSKYTPKTIEEK
ncbi:MAG: nucleotide exchange factor GrpE [bacterium]